MDSACTSDDLVTLWTIQPAAIWDELQRQGVIGAKLPDRRRTYTTYRRAHVWMAGQMRQRGIAIDLGAGPCWAWFAHRLTAKSEKPDLRSAGLLRSGTRGARIRLTVPSSQVLLSQFLMWEYVLLGEYVVLDRNELHRVEKSDPSQDEREGSWQRIFELEAGDPELWEPLERRPIQACLGKVELSWVRNVDMFWAR